jgi:hypothetical protein
MLCAIFFKTAGTLVIGPTLSWKVCGSQNRTILDSFRFLSLGRLMIIKPFVSSMMKRFTPHSSVSLDL